MADLDKALWKDEHLAKLHTRNFSWCPLCVARAQGEANPQQHLTPPQQDPSQTGMDYLKPDYKPDDPAYYGGAIASGKVPAQAGQYVPGPANN